MKNWFKKRKLAIIFLLILLPICIILVLVISAVFFSFIQDHKITYETVKNQLCNNSGNKYLYIGLFFSIVYLFYSLYLLIFRQKSKKYISSSEDNTYGSASWADKKEINSKYNLVSLLEPNDNYGIVANSYETKLKNMMVNIRSETHTMVVAGTRSGKTQGIVIPTLQLFARSNAKPSVLVTDPKGELFETNSKVFQENGYEVIRLDLRNPELSLFWNPLSIAFNNWKFGCELEDKYNNNPKDTSASLYYSFQQKALDYLSDICQTLFPVTDPKERFWQESAAGVVKGLLMAILYDMKSNNTFDENKFNLASVIPMINNKDEIIDYLKSLDVTHPARISASSLLDGAKETTASVLQSLKTGLEKFSDPILRTLIANNNINLTKIINKPHIVFLIVPDDRTDRHVFATLFISQIYKLLIEIADKSNKMLTRPFYFILDEFANIPQIPDMGPKISVSGGRNIWWLLIIQDKPQLVSKYGEDMAQSINNNCSMHIFLQTMDNKTASYYSDMIGERTVVSKSISTSSSTKGKNDSSTTSVREAKLITPGDLRSLPPGEGIVIYSKEKPFKAKFIPMWKSQNYIKGCVDPSISIPITDNEFKEKYYYDLASNNINLNNKLNSIINKYSNDDSNDKLERLKLEKRSIQTQILNIELKDFIEQTVDDKKIVEELNKKLNFINQQLKETTQKD